MSATPADLARDTAVQALAAAPGWYTADLPPHWDYRTPSGGVLMTVALRAMQAEVGHELRPVSATALFCSPVPSGPLEIRVEVIRRGNVACQVRAGLSSTSLPGPGLEVSGTFVREKDGPDVIGKTMPADLRLPDACEELLGPRIAQAPPFFRNFESRIALGHRWWESDWEAGEARFGRWHRYLVPQRGPGGLIDPLAIPPIADTMPESLRMRMGPIGPTHPPFTAPSLDLTVHFVEETDDEWLCTHATCRRARKGYATADVEVWDRRGRLVAFGTQVMILRKRPP